MLALRNEFLVLIAFVSATLFFRWRRVEKKAAPSSVQVFRGFVEHAYRLVFVYADHFPDKAPLLQTILPSGVEENSKVLEPKKEKGIIAYAYPQTVDAAKAAKLSSPYVFKRPDGSFGLVQTWATNFNAKFEEDFTVTAANPDPSKFSQQAADELHGVATALFGPAAAAQPIRFCHKASTNDRPVYMGTTEAILAYLQATPAAVASLNLASLTPDGFVANTLDGKGHRGTKAFKMARGEAYAVYTKLGWDTMACATPREQFMRDRELRR